MKSLKDSILESLQNILEAEESIKSEKDFRDYAENKFKEVFADDLDEDQMKETIDGILNDNKELNSEEKVQ